jgi:hypothetical protein
MIKNLRDEFGIVSPPKDLKKYFPNHMRGRQTMCSQAIIGISGHRGEWLISFH